MADTEFDGKVLPTNGSVMLVDGSILLANESVLMSNDTFNNVTNDDIIEDLNPGEFAKWEVRIFLSVLFIVIIVGNLTVLLAIGLSKRGVSSRMNFFILHMAIADLSVGLLSVLPDLLSRFTSEWIVGNVMCKLMRYVQAVALYASTYVLVSLSIDRMDAIARPLNFSCSDRRAKILIGAAWALSFVFSIPEMILSEDRIWEVDNSHQCGIHSFNSTRHWQIYITPIAISLFVLPGIIIMFCYVMIIFTIFSKSKLMAANAGATRNNGVRNRSDRQPLDSTSSSRGIIPQAKIRTIKMTLVIVIVFILCWSPYFIFNLIDVYSELPRTHRVHAIRIFIQTVAPLNSAINPIIYGIFSTRICRNLRRIRALDWILSRICCRPSPGENLRSSRSTSMATYTLYADSHRCTAGSHSRRLSEQPGRTGGSRRASGTSCLHSPLKKREAEIVMRNLQRDRNHKSPGAASVS